MKTMLLVAMVLAAFASPAAVLNWTNTANGNWSVPANWSPNQVPSTNDTAVIVSAGAYTATLNIDATVAGLIIGGDSGTQTLSIAGQTLTVNGSATIGPRGVLGLSSGYSTIAGIGRIDLQGRLNWGGGTFSTNVELTVAEDAVVSVASGANFSKFLYGTLTNHGTIEWLPAGSFLIGGRLHNAGLFDARRDGTLGRTGNGVIINDGVFRKSAGTGSLDCQVPLINNGVVDTQTGRLLLADRSMFNSGSDFTGAGETTLDSGTNTLNGSVHSENLVLRYSATLAGTGTLSGTLTWGGGTIGSDAAITIATNGQLLITSGANYAKNIHGRLTNAGTITWRPLGGLDISGLLHNLPGALFDAQFDGTIHQAGGGLIINAGVFRKSAGVSAAACLVPTIHHGTVDTQSGRLTLADGSVFNSGCVFIGAGETWLDSGTNTLNGSVSSSNLMLYGATLVGAGSLSGKVTWHHGAIGPGAAITVAPNGELLISSGGFNFAKYLLGSLTNAGTITWQPTGTLVIGGTLHNLGTFDAQINGRIAVSGDGALIINDGTFQKSVTAGSTDCEVPFINNGTARVSSGMLSFEGAYANPSGTIRLAGGTFRTFQPLWLAGGQLTGWGTVSADVTNAACIRPSSSNGVLTITGMCNQLLGGRMEFEIAGNIPGTNQSRLNIAGPATLRGTVGVLWNEGYIPSPGTSFPVLTFASHAGEFCCFDNLIRLGHSRRLTPAYTATSLTLTTIAAPDPTNFPLRIAVDGGALISWPVEFTGFELYWSTNLNFTNWTLIPGITNRYLEPPPLPREKFFRLRKAAAPDA